MASCHDASSALQEVALGGASGSPECELILGEVEYLLCAGHCAGCCEQKDEGGGDRTHKLAGIPPDKRGPRVRHKTLGEQRGMALGMSAPEGFPGEAARELGLGGEWSAISRGVLGLGGEK